MRRNCNLELRLFPACSSSLPSIYSDHGHHMMEENNGSPQQKQGEQQQQLQQPLTIFYNGKICVADVTEFQARAILLFASNKEIEERMRSTPTGSSPASSSSSLQSPLYSPTSGLSMKRSLQQFLQNRKHRNQATSPYHH